MFITSKTTHRCLLTFGALLTLSAAPASLRAQALQPGEILVNEFGNGSVERYSADGTLEQTYGGGTGTFSEGASVTPDGSVVTANEYTSTPSGVSISVFNADGTLKTSFDATGNGGFAGDVSVFANGNLALSDQDGPAIQIYSPTGTLLYNVALPGVADPFGNTVGSDGVLYVADADGNDFGKVDANGNFLGAVALSFDPADIVMNPQDGTLWVTNFGDGLTVEHIQTDGTVLGSFPTDLSGVAGIGLAPDDQSLYVDSQSDSTVDHYDLNGNLLDSFALANGGNNPLFLTVIGVPEPSTWVMLLGGLGLLGGARRLRRS